MRESGEMYLETILKLAQEKPEVHAIHISEEMGISKPSVSRALTRLKNEGCLIVDRSGQIGFTEKGRRIAMKITERHHVLTEMLTGLGISRETADADACRIEHDISDETFEAIRKHMTQK